MALSPLFQLALAVTRRIYRNQLYDWMMAISQRVDEQEPGALSFLSEPSDGMRTGMVLNSLCEPNPSFPEWTVTPGTIRWGHQATFQQNLDAMQLNPYGNPGGTGELLWTQVLPPGANGAVFSCALAEPSSISVRMGIRDITGGSAIVAQSDLVTTPAFQTFSVAFPAGTGLPSPRQYGFFFQPNQNNQNARPFIANVQITPTFPAPGYGTGTFGLDPLVKGFNFRRISLYQAGAIGNQLAGIDSGVIPFLNTFTDFSIELSALSAAVEGFNLATDGVLWTFLNGAPYQKIGSTAIMPNGALAMVDVPITPAPGLTTQAFKVRGGAGTGPAAITNPGFNAVTLPRALFIPANSSFAFVPQRGRAKCLIIGDSITAGSLATNPGFQGWFARFREWYPGEVIVDALGGQGLIDYVGSATPAQDHPDLQLKLAQYSARSNPTDIIFDLQTNDYIKGNGVNHWDAAAYQTALLGYAVNLMALAPQARIWLKTMTISTQEAVANAAGSTPPNYRTATGNVVTQINDPRVILINGLGALMPVAGDLPPDNFHPNTGGQQKIFDAISAQMGLVFAI